MFAEHLGWFRAVGGGYSTCPARKAEQTAFPDLCTMCGPSPWSPRCFVVYWVLTKALAAYSSVKRAPLPLGAGRGSPRPRGTHSLGGLEIGAHWIFQHLRGTFAGQRLVGNRAGSPGGPFVMALSAPERAPGQDASAPSGHKKELPPEASFAEGAWRRPLPRFLHGSCSAHQLPDLNPQPF